MSDQQVKIMPCPSHSASFFNLTCVLHNLCNPLHASGAQRHRTPSVSPFCAAFWTVALARRAGARIGNSRTSANACVLAQIVSSSSSSAVLVSHSLINLCFIMCEQGGPGCLHERIKPASICMYCNWLLQSSPEFQSSGVRGSGLANHTLV